MKDKYVEQWTDDKVTPEMMMSLAELIYQTEGKDFEKYWDLMHKQPIPIWEVTIPNCYMLALSLYSAETFRKTFVSDKEQDVDFMQFDRRLRNGCYAIYLQARIEKIRAQLANRNDFIREPLEIEMIRGLYPMESECVKHFMDKEENTFVRQAMEYFMLYLTDYIGRKYPDEIAWAQARTAAKNQPSEAPKKEDNYPPKGNYVRLVAWLKQEKEAGRDYFAEADYNRSEMCRRLSKIVGWVVDENSLRKAQNR